MSDWLSRGALARMSGIDAVPRGSEPLAEILRREPELMLSVAGPGRPPIDLATYRVRHQRWRGGSGPVLRGIERFMDVLEGRDEPICAVSVEGESTSYVLLLNKDRTAVLAGVAIDPARSEEGPSDS